MEKSHVPITFLVAQDELGAVKVIGQSCDSVSENDTKSPGSDDSDTV